MDASRHTIYQIEESTYGTTPTNPAWNTVRHTGTNLGLSKGTLESAELRADRQIVDFRHGTHQTGGNINGELSYGTYDAFFEAVLCGEWTGGAGSTITAITISAAAADDSFNDSGNGFLTAGFNVGDRITVSGFTGTVANNASYLIVTVVAGKITVTKADGTAATNIVDDAAGESVTIAKAGNTLKAGVERRSFSILRHFTDGEEADNPFHLFNGVEYGSFSLEVSPEQIVTVSFTTLGRQAAQAAGTAPSGSTYVAANTNGVIDAFTGSLMEGGATIGTVTSVNLTLENGLQPRYVVGSKFTRRPSIQKSRCSGEITVFFENSTMLNKFVNETISSLDLKLQDLDGNVVRFLLPRVKYNGGQPDVEGEGPITLTMPFIALYDSTTEAQIQIDRIPVA